MKDNLNLCQIFAKFLPCLLNEEWRGNLVCTCEDLQESLERDPECLSEIITYDETWVEIKGRNFNYHVTVLQAKLWDAFFEFQIIHCTKCSELWGSLQAQFINCGAVCRPSVQIVGQSSGPVYKLWGSL